MKRQKKKKGWLRWGLVLVIAAWFRIGIRSSYQAAIVFPEGTEIQIAQGERIGKFYSHLGGFQHWMMKLWMRNHKELIPMLQEGNYLLSGSYSKAELMELIRKGPQLDYERLTVLEGWSIYDTDALLAAKGFIDPGDFIAKANDGNFIGQLKSEFSFLEILPVGKSLEGFLYPDTYFLAKQGEFSEQLIRAQLKAFEQKVWMPYGAQLQQFGHSLSPYQVLILASVIENEEKKAENKPIIAGIFLNRLEKGMRLDADVTLCYGLKITYDQCHQNILPNLNDASNPYNTRQLYGLMPTPISSPSVETLSALLNFEKSDYLFYLHNEKSGQIYYGKTLEEHLSNKAKYL